MKVIRFILGLFRVDRSNWKAVSLCILTASVFWLFNAFNKSHTATLHFPLTVEYNHERFAPLRDLPQSIALNVTGTGWDLFTHYVGFKVPHLLIALDKPTETKKIVGSTLVPVLSNQVGRLHINHVLTDTLHVQLDLRDNHSYKLIADLSSIAFEKGLGRVSPIVILPDSVLLDGPQSVLHNLPESISVKLPPQRINSNFKSEVEVDLAEKELIKIEPRTVKIIFDVGAVEDVKKRIALNQKKSKRDSIDAWFQIPVTKLESFEEDSREIKAAVVRARIKFSRVPEYAILLKTDSIK